MAGGMLPIGPCPSCGCGDLRKFDELRDRIREENLSAGELAGYRAGKRGTILCNACGLVIDYQQQ